MKSFLLIFVLLTTTFFYSQNVGINSTGANPDNAAMLDIVAADKGLLIPRVNIIDLSTAAPITAPVVTSTLVYNSNVASGVGYYYWDGSKWNRLYDQTLNGEDHDWYEVGGTSAPNNISDNIFTQGNVGIGNINPGRAIVLGNNIVQLSSANSVATEADILFDASGNIAAEGNQHFMIDSDNNSADLSYFSFHKNSEGITGAPELMRIQENGNVGIGTNVPTDLLHVDGGQIHVNKDATNGILGSIKLSGVNSTATEANERMWTIYNMNEYGAIDGLTFWEYYDANGDNSFCNDGVGNCQANVTFARGGNVGIGTTTPSQKLEVTAGHVQVDQNYGIGKTIGSTTSEYMFYPARAGVQSMGQLGASSPSDLAMTLESDHIIGFVETDSEDLVGYMEVNLDYFIWGGNIGLGTITPNAKIQVVNGTINLHSSSQYGGDYPTDNNNYTNVIAVGGIGAEAGMKIYKQNSGSGGTFTGASNWYDSYVFEITDGNDADPDGAIVFGSTGNDDVFEGILYIRGNKRIGMGVMTPAYKLELPNSATNSVGRARANSWAVYSDKRVKSNVKTINYGVDAIMKLEPSSYFQHNSTSDSLTITLSEEGENNIGFLAQDLYKVIPEAVFKPENDRAELWSVDYTRLVPVLTKAIQEQEERILYLEKQIEFLLKKED